MSQGAVVIEVGGGEPLRLEGGAGIGRPFREPARAAADQHLDDRTRKARIDEIGDAVIVYISQP